MAKPPHPFVVARRAIAEIRRSSDAARRVAITPRNFRAQVKFWKHLAARCRAMEARARGRIEELVPELRRNLLETESER